MKLKLIVVLFAVALGLLLIIPLGAFCLLQSPGAINSLSSLLEHQIGYRVHVRDIALDRRLHARVEGLEIRSVKDSSLFLSASTAEFNGRLAPSFKVEIEKMLLMHPRFVFQVKKSAEETNLFAALEKIPPVRLLVVQDGRLEVTTEGTAYVIPAIHLTVKDFAPKKGGDLKLEGDLSVTSTPYAFAGAFDGAFKMTRFTPSPSGTGSIHLSLSKAQYDVASIERAVCTSGMKLNGDVLSFDGMKLEIGSVSSGTGRGAVAVRDVHLGMNLSYDQRSSKFSVTSLEGGGSGIAMLKGGCEGFVKPLSWAASLSASGVDIPRVFAIIRPLLPQDYSTWTFKGLGAVEVRTEGRTDDRLLWNADVLLDVKEGGFASADNFKAGERITGKIHLKLTSPERGTKGKFDVTARAGEGEILWGGYYRDFKGEFCTISSQGSFLWSPLLISCFGSADFFQTGAYTFSADLSPGDYHLALGASDLSHERLFTVLIKDYVAQSNQETANLKVSGQSDLRLLATIKGNATDIRGQLTVRNGAVDAPSLGLSLAGLQVSLPLDFIYPAPAVTGGLEGDQGFLSFERLETGGLEIDDLRVPLLLTGNSFLTTVEVDAPLFGGVAHLTHLRVDGLLSPDIRLDAGLVVDHVDLAALTEKVAPLTVAGTLGVALPSVTYRNGQWKTRGKIDAEVFGGDVEITNIFADNVFSRGRSFGGDVRFSDIDLEKMTEKIEVGKITGIVDGFARDLVFEYGQPSRFVLNVETDVTKKGSREISVDAIKNLSIVSTGSSAVSSILSSGVNRFFKEYPYSRIGIACSLENDIFSLRGTIREGGKEYLVRRAVFRGIDVVNQNPDNSISFKDMQERISRIFRPREERKNVS